MVFSFSTLGATEEHLKNTLNPEHYEVGRGGNHVFVSKKRDPNSTQWPERLAMLVDPDNKGIWTSFPNLRYWRAA